MLEFLKCLKIGIPLALAALIVVGVFMSIASLLIVYLPLVFFVFVFIGLSWVLGSTYRSIKSW